jgi:hypothetical protein
MYTLDEDTGFGRSGALCAEFQGNVFGSIKAFL